MKLYRPLPLLAAFYSLAIYSQTVNVTTAADSGGGSLRQAITDINAGSDASNTINLQVPGNSPIIISSDLPVIKKNNTEIISTGQQPINGQGQYRLFATIMADLSLTNCNLDQGAAIGGSGRGGGMGAGGGVYIDRGNTLTLTNNVISSCKAKGGNGTFDNGGGGASFSTANKNASGKNGGGDYPGLSDGSGGASDGSPFLIGYGGGNGGLPNGANGGGNQSGDDGTSTKGGNGGYCGGGGGWGSTGGGGGGNGGGNRTSGTNKAGGPTLMSQPATTSSSATPSKPKQTLITGMWRRVYRRNTPRDGIVFRLFLG